MDTNIQVLELFSSFKNFLLEFKAENKYLGNFTNLE